MGDAGDERLRALRSECGCRSGLAALLVSVVAYTLHSTLIDPIIRSHSERLVTTLGVALAGAVVGKIAGILAARYRYRQLTASQSHTLS